MSTSPFRKRNPSAFSNFLRAKYNMYTGAARVDSYPYYLCVDPSDICQLRCPTCPTGVENESRRQKESPLQVYRDDRQKMSPALFDALLDEVGEYVFLMMLYNFGEPLLNAHLPSFIRKASDLDIETEVHTNLSLKVSDERVDQLLDSGLDRLEVSADGFSQGAYEVHRVGGNVALVKQNLERLAAAKERLGSATRITYKLLVFSHNEHEVDAARAYCERIGIEFSSPDGIARDESWVPARRRGEKPVDPRADPEELERTLATWDQAGRKDYFLEADLRPTWGLPPLGSPFPAACGWHYGYSVITAGGCVTPCCGTAKQVDDFGTVSPGTTSFADVWNGPYYQKARATFGGRAPAELQGVDTVCERCYFPKFLQHLYSSHDQRVADAFRLALTQPGFAESAPALENAFALLPANSPEADVEPFVEIVRASLNPAEKG